MTPPGRRSVLLPPLRGESLTGYVQRFNATGLTPLVAMPANSGDADLPAPLAAAVQKATGLDPEQVRHMTMAGWPLALRGRRVQRRHGWALHRRTVWLCPTCTPLAGYRALRWRLALAPVCVRCHTVLTHDGKQLEPARPATGQEVSVVQRLDELTTQALHGSSTARSHLSLLRRLCAAGGSDAAPNQPPPLLSSDQRASKRDFGWGAHPPSDPSTVLARLVTLGPLLISEGKARQHWKRLDHDASLHPSTGLSPTAQEPTTRAPGTTCAAHARTRRRALLRQLAELSARTGLQPAHIPTVLSPRRPAQWSRVRDLEDQGFEALALHTLLLEATGTDARGSIAFDAHRIPAVVNQHDLLDRVRTHDSLSGKQCERILAHAHSLVDAGLLDYAYRRGVLVGVPALPRIPAVRLPRHPFWPPRVLVSAWAWLDYARGLPEAGPLPEVSLEALDRFHSELDAEAHLLLTEAFEAHVNGEDWAKFAAATGPLSSARAYARQRSA